MKHLFAYLILLLFFAGCKEEIVETPDFGVSVTVSTSNAGEAVTFQFTGNPDFIYFYSGENGKRYDYAGRAFENGTPQLKFTSVRANGKQEGSLRLMVSQDFPGITVGDNPATIAKIAAATWSDITDRAVLSAGTSTNSGAINLSDFAQSEKPVFIAFKYLAFPGSIQNKWTISGLTVTNNLPDGTVYTLANTTSTAITNYGVTTTFSPGWVFYKVSDNYGWSLSSNNLVITGATTVAGATASVEAWAIMGSIDLRKVTPDVGLHLKGLDTRLDSYSYTYTAAGTYTATFVASSNNVYGTKEIIKSVDLVINP
ncbi:MAG: DUF5017 domain-containing protein [Mangrovibacterium sp.]